MHFNAGPPRFLLAVIGASIFYALMGAALHSVQIALWFFLWALIIGPVACSLGLFAWLKLRTQHLSISNDTNLRRAALHSILKSPGPRIQFGIYNSKDLSIFWYASLLHSNQVNLFMSDSWFKDAKQNSSEKLLVSWYPNISSIPRTKQKIRTLAFIYWCAWVLPFDLLFQLWSQMVFLVFKTNIPPINFFAQRVFLSFKNLCFGNALENKDQALNKVFDSILSDTAYRQSFSNRYFRTPRPAFIWNSLIFGPWFLIGASNSHPLWPILFDPELFFDAYSK